MRLSALVILPLTLLGLFVLAPKASDSVVATGYGISTAGANQGTSEPVATCRVERLPCPASRLRLAAPFRPGSTGSGAFAAFRGGLLAGGGHVRLWVPYDAVSAWHPARGRAHGSCGPSRYLHGPRARFNGLDGATVFRHLVWNIQGVLKLGLRPELVISAGSGEGVSSYPDPGYGNRRDLFAGLTGAGLDYRCGVTGIVSRLRAELGAGAPAEFEAFNEPDGQSAYQGSRGKLCGRRYTGCGALEAAELWQIADRAITAREPGAKVAALTMMEPESGYGRRYVEQLRALASCMPGFVARPAGSGTCVTSARFPRYWAVHDYDDPTAGGTADLRAFEAALSRARTTSATVSVWVTEAGVELESPAPSDLNRQGCAPSRPRGVLDPHRAGGGGTSSNQPTNLTLGACVDGQPANQARGARAWRALLRAHAPGVRTTEVYWYEFELLRYWDSALVDSHGRARRSLCALVTGVRCDGNPTAYLLRRG